MSVAGWRCFHMCALLIFFLSCEELVLLTFPLSLLCIQAGTAACRGPEKRTRAPFWPCLTTPSTYFKWLSPRVATPQFPITPHRVSVGNYYALFPLPVPSFTAIWHIASEMACSYSGLTITRPPLRPFDLNLIWFIIGIGDVRAHAQQWCYQ